MTKIHFLIFLSVILLAGTACRENENTDWTNKSIELQDVDVPTTVVWQQLEPNTVNLFNSTTELPEGVAVGKEIDFDRYSLIIVWGEETGGIQRLAKQLTQTSPNEYTLVVDVALDSRLLTPSWVIAARMPKLSGQSRFDLKIEKTVKEFPKTIIPEEIRNDHFLGNSIVAKRNLVIKTDEEWENLLAVAKDLHRKLMTLEMLGSGIEIDFSKHQVIAVFDVPKGNSGCSVNIANITEYADSIVVDVHSLVTEHGWAGITQAYHLVKIPVSDKKVIFHKEQINNERENFPVKIPFENYGLTGSSCRWQFTKIPCSVLFSILFEGITIVNSNEELEDYTVCSGDTFPEIDFSEHTLLLVRGASGSSPSEVLYTALFEYSAKEYVLKVVVSEGGYLASSTWLVAILTPKIPNGATVTLDFKQTTSY